MLVKHKKTFNMGVLLALSFFVVLALIFSPVFGGKTGLEYSDDLFNKLSKGSSYFIPKLAKSSEQYNGKNFAVAVKMDKPEQVDRAVKILGASGTQVSAAGTELKISGDLGTLTAHILNDADAMFKNDGAKVSAPYGMDASEVMTLWWNILSKMDKELKKEKKIDEANFVGEVTKKGIEPAFNFYQIEAQNVTDKAGVMTGLLIFYVAYTMWWGYAIFYLFDGLGLSMKKAKVKKEV
jgi:hypothetical protein